MKPTPQIHDPYHNPFHNRFHVPVHSRIDEMQAYTNLAWLNELAALDQREDRNQNSQHRGRALAGAFALLLVVIFSATLLSN